MYNQAVCTHHAYQVCVNNLGDNEDGEMECDGNTFPNHASSRQLSGVENSGQYNRPDTDFLKFP
jgi:hypothetical protein